MVSRQYDIAIAYRIYPGVSKTPIVFSDNKYKLAELCLKSFKASLGTLKVKMWVLLDNCPKEYEELFRCYFDSEDLEFIPLNRAGNLPTFGMQLDILLKQDNSELIYFAEDDYYYLPNQFEQMVKFLRAHEDVHFVTAYDHIDYYTLALHKHRNHIRVFENRHWRTANSTCLTFLTTKSTLRRSEAVFRTYTRNNFDASVWLSLTKHELFNIFRAFKYLFKDRLLFKILVKAWFYGWKQILFGKRWSLWAPIPTIATAVEETGLAPTYDWMSIVMRDVEEIDRETKATQP